jgi:hypothetical protein
MEQEEQDYETPLKDLENQSGEMDEELEQQRRDTEGVQSEWDNRQTDTGTPGAQEKESLEEEYGGDEESEEDAGSKDEGESDEDEDDGDSDESRGEGATEEDDEN